MGRHIPIELDDPAWPAAVQRLHLSPMQASVVALMTTEASAEEIAERLGWGVPTAEVYVDDIMQHLGVLDRRALNRLVVLMLMLGPRQGTTP